MTPQEALDLLEDIDAHPHVSEYEMAEIRKVLREVVASAVPRVQCPGCGEVVRTRAADIPGLDTGQELDRPLPHIEIHDGGYPRVYMIETTPGGGWLSYNLAGSGLAWSRMEWPTRSFLRGLAHHILSSLADADETDADDRH